MEFLQALLLSTSLLSLESYTIESGDCLLLNLFSTQTRVSCPLCGGLTHRIHSHYERTLADLPCVHFKLRLILQVRKFFCVNSECRRRIFTERLPGVAAPWARKTVRLIERLQSIGLAQGWLQTAIAQKVGVSLKTVERYSSLPDFPEIPPHRPTFGGSLLEPYKPQLLDWWNAGIRESSILMKLLEPWGFKGSLRTLQRYLRGWREAQGLLPVRIKVVRALPKVVDPPSPPLTPRRAAYLVVLRSENRQAEDVDLLEQLVKQHDDLALLVELSNEFLQLLRQRQADAFDDWLLRAAGCAIEPLPTFAKGLFDDYAAVKASLMNEVNNDPVEGLNNKLKMLKRQMYGRADLELLAKRLIMAA